MGVKDNSVLTQAQARNTEHSCLPEGAKRAQMNAACRIAHVIRQIDLCSLAEIGLCQGSILQTGGDEGINGRTQRTAMPSTRLVVAEVRLVHRKWPFFPLQRAQCHYVRLLDRLRPADAFRS